MNILGIDYGLKNIGLAISQGKLSEPLGQLKRVNDILLIKKLGDICLKNKIKMVIIGLPEGKLAARVKKFGQDIKEKIGLPVTFQDETLTSQEAVEKMMQIGKPLKKRQSQEHTFSACLILQSYLDFKN